jgi:CRISPR-associated protein Csm3
MTIQFQGNLVITGKILCETGLHIGGVSESIEIGGLENIVIRDPKTGLPFIPGSSLKGKMRSLLELSDKDASRNIIENKGEPCKCGKCAPCRIFGTPALDLKTMEGRQQGPTRIVVRDCHLTKDSIDELDKMNVINRTEVKSENTLNRITSEANPRTIERVPKGSVFSFEIVFSVYNDDDYTNFLGVFHSIRLLEDSYLGGSGTRGSGQVKFKDINMVKRSVEYYKVKDVEKTIECGKMIFDILDDENLIDKLK